MTRFPAVAVYRIDLPPSVISCDVTEFFSGGTGVFGRSCAAAAAGPCGFPRCWACKTDTATNTRQAMSSSERRECDTVGLLFVRRIATKRHKKHKKPN